MQSGVGQVRQEPLRSGDTQVQGDGGGRQGGEQLDGASEGKGGPATRRPRATNYTCPQTGLKTGRCPQRFWRGFPKLNSAACGCITAPARRKGRKKP